MTDTEKRLKILERQMRLENERWHSTQSRLKALSMIIDSISAPVCAANPLLLPVIVKNIKAYEKEARVLNQHADLLWQLRQARKFFEARLANLDKGGLKPLSGGGLPKRK
jgi:hypothetical protein